MNNLLTLNEQQEKAVTFEGKHLLVLAGAGTGKTHTLVSRAAHLIKNGVPANKILIISFTRKSAREIVARINSQFADAANKGLTGQTFHSWCSDIIQKHPNIFGIQNYSLMDADDILSAFKLISGKNFKDKDGNYIYANYFQEVYSYMINTKKNLSDSIRIKITSEMSNNTAQAYIDHNKKYFTDVIKKYIVYKQSKHYIDYDDLLNIVAKTLEQNSEARDYISSNYEHILVDEMQDTNPLQYQLLSQFYQKCHLFCVGDDAQSIYSFRGADFKAVHNFIENVPDSRVYKLTLNYRSTQAILDLSNWLLSNSTLKYGKELLAVRGRGIKPKIININNDFEEANDIADKIIYSLSSKGMKYEDHLVLCRSSFGLHKIEGICITKKIPYQILGGNKLFQSAHVRDVVSPMRIIANYRDELAWMRYLELWEGIGNVTATKIISQIIGAKDLNDCLSKLILLGNDINIADTLILTMKYQSNPSEAISGILSFLETQLKRIYKKDWESRRKHDFPVLKEIASNSGSLSEFITEYVLDPSLNETLKEGASTTKDFVTLSTIHSAKGLEAKACYVLNVSPHAYPNAQAILDGKDAIEEERRCLYVALTRAQNELYIYRNLNSITSIKSNTNSIDAKEGKNENYFLNGLPEALVDNNVQNKHSPYTNNYRGPLMTIKLDDLDFQ